MQWAVAWATSTAREARDVKVFILRELTDILQTSDRFYTSN